MRGIIFLIFFTLGSECVMSQPLKVGVSTGFGACFSSYYDLQIDPQKTFSTVEPIIRLSLDYQPFKSNRLFLSSGISFIRLSNAFQVEGPPYFPIKEGFPKIKQRYTGIQIPVCMGYNWPIGKNVEFHASIGVSFLQINRSSFYEYKQDILTKNINGNEYVLDYDFGFRSINKTNICILSNIGLSYKVSKRMGLVFAISPQQGIKPILGSILTYKIINQTNPFTLNGDAYVTSKGDGLFMMGGFTYAMGKIKKTK